MRARCGDGGLPAARRGGGCAFGQLSAAFDELEGGGSCGGDERIVRLQNRMRNLQNPRAWKQVLLHHHMASADATPPGFPPLVAALARARLLEATPGDAEAEAGSLAIPLLTLACSGLRRLHQQPQSSSAGEDSWVDSQGGEQGQQDGGENERDQLDFCSPAAAASFVKQVERDVWQAAMCAGRWGALRAFRDAQVASVRKAEQALREARDRAEAAVSVLERARAATPTTAA